MTEGKYRWTPVHTKGYKNTADEVYDRNPVCDWCEQAWPCDASEGEQRIAALRDLYEDMLGEFGNSPAWVATMLEEFDRVAKTGSR